MKDKAFARSVNRDDIINGAADLGHRPGRTHRLLHRSHEGIAKELGLDGSAGIQG